MIDKKKKKNDWIFHHDYYIFNNVNKAYNSHRQQWFIFKFTSCVYWFKLFKRSHTRNSFIRKKFLNQLNFYTHVKSIFPKMETFQGLQGCSDSRINAYLIFFLTDRNMNETKVTYKMSIHMFYWNFHWPPSQSQLTTKPCK